MDRKVMDPDHEYGYVDGEDAEHEYEDGMGVIMEIVGGW